MTALMTSKALAHGLRERLSNRVVLQPHQIPPWDDPEDPTHTNHGFVLLTGRGGGKSFATMWDLHLHLSMIPNLRARVIAPTLGDGIAAAVDGPNGLLKLSGGQARWLPSAPGGACVKYPNGSRAWIVGTPTEKDVDRLRALTNIDYDVFEELFANPCAQSAFDQAALSRRRGVMRWVVSSTPRPHQLIKDWENDPKVTVRRGKSTDNKYIPLDWLAKLEKMYKGTRLYRQEVLGEVIEDVEGALWRALDIERSRVAGPASAVASICDRIVVGVDPPTGMGTCGIVVVGMDETGHMYVLDDRSVEEASPNVWAARVKSAADTYDAVVIAEINQGGQMVKEVLNSAGHALPIHTVNATKSKKTRAEPIALLWEVEEQIIHMVTESTALIDQMCHPAGTMITTRRGQVPIEDVLIDDEVLTRAGFAPLRWVGQTGESDELVTITHSNDLCVTMTPCHPVWNPEKFKFVSASSVRRGDLLSILPERISTLKGESGGEETGTPTTRPWGTTLADERSMGRGFRSSFIVRLTKRMSDLSRKVLSFTTRTTIPSTIDPRTLLRFLDRHTTWRMTTGQTLSVPMSPSTLLKSGVSELEITSGRTANLVMSRVSHVAPSSSQPECEPSIATSTVRDVVISRLNNPVPVYNLQVADPWPHEFFADGVLVHNCEWVPGEGASPDRVDALVWACWYLRSRHTAVVRNHAGIDEKPVLLPSALSSVRMGRF